tara:strand:+ start:5706 stop:6419 length:714 start_codon:yes stop_codon:yes gene_type:complete
MFLSQDNKGFLWDLMLENDTFKKEIDNNMIGVKTTFDNLLKDIDQKNNDLELLEKNKLFLVEINLKINSQKLVTNEQISNHRVSDFESRLKKRQSDFTISMKKDTPDEISFKDNIDEPLLNVENELQKKIAERKYDNTDISNENITEAKEWIGLDLKIEDISLNKLEEIHTPTPEILGDTFIAETELDIFSKLKKVDNSSDKNKSNNNDEILMLLKIMDKKIDIVMEYIENMKNSNK